MLGDEFLDEDQPLLPAMLDLQARTGGIVLAFLEVDWTETSRYGIASVSPAPDLRARRSEPIRARRGVPGDRPGREADRGQGAEQPRRGRAGTCCRRRSSTRSGASSPGAGGEIQLTDAMALLLSEGVPVHGIVYRGVRYDTGLPLGYLQAVVQVAAEAGGPRARVPHLAHRLRQERAGSTDRLTPWSPVRTRGRSGAAAGRVTLRPSGSGPARRRAVGRGWQHQAGRWSCATRVAASCCAPTSAVTRAPGRGAGSPTRPWLSVWEPTPQSGTWARAELARAHSG